MPSICVDLNGKRLATVNSDGFDVLAVHVDGATAQEVLASLDFSGYSREAEQSRIWINALPLNAGDEVTVSMDAPAEAPDKGTTIAQLYPDAEPAETYEFPKMTDEWFNEIASRRQYHAGFMFRLQSSLGTDYSGSTHKPESGFRFHVLWDFTRQNRARVALSSNSLENIRHRQKGRDHVREELATGRSVTLRVIGSSLIPGEPG